MTTTTLLVAVSEGTTTEGTVTVTPSDYTDTYPTEYTTITTSYSSAYPDNGDYPTGH